MRGGARHVAFGLDGEAGEEFGLGNVGSEEEGMREQLVDEGLLRIR